MVKAFGQNPKDAGLSPAQCYSFPCQIASGEKLFINYSFHTLFCLPACTVVVRVVHSHGMLRLGIQGLMLQGNSWFV